MAKQYFIIYTILVIFYASIDAKKSATQAPTTAIPVELVGEENNVKVHFMDLKKSEFVEMLPKTKDAFEKVFGEYCSNNDICSAFEADEYSLGIVGETEKEKYEEDNRYIITKLYMTYLDDKNETQYVPKNVLTDFMTSQRDKLVKESKIDIGFINNAFVYPKRNNLENYIIIPISVAFVLALVIFNFVCQKKREKEILSEIANKTPIVKNKDSKNKNRDTDDIELRSPNDDDHRYLEPVPRFPVPSDRYENQPMLDNPRNIRYTEV